MSRYKTLRSWSMFLIVIGVFSIALADIGDEVTPGANTAARPATV